MVCHLANDERVIKKGAGVLGSVSPPCLTTADDRVGSEGMHIIEVRWDEPPQADGSKVSDDLSHLITPARDAQFRPPVVHLRTFYRQPIRAWWLKRRFCTVATGQ